MDLRGYYLRPDGNLGDIDVKQAMNDGDGIWEWEQRSFSNAKPAVSQPTLT